MGFKSGSFNVDYKDMGNGNFLHVINIEEIDEILKSLIDKSIVSICEGKTETDLNTIKLQIANFLNTKKGTTTEMGAIAEFFIHLYLNEIGFKQEFLYLNLEERSIKKGFDGYYSYNNEEWIMESKSGNIMSKGINHRIKIKEAYNDLENKIEGNTENDPWKNAYNHASHKDVDCSESIRKNLKKLSNEFIMKTFHDIKDFNIIPGSTIFLEGAWESANASELDESIVKLISEFRFTKINIICINKKSIQLFWDYLNN